MNKYTWQIKNFFIYTGSQRNRTYNSNEITVFVSKSAMTKRKIMWVLGRAQSHGHSDMPADGGYVNWNNISGGQFGSAFQTY